MTGSVSRGWQIFFFAAAAYNFVIGLGSFLSAPWGSADAVSAALIICFGIVYALVASDPLRFAPTLIAGVIGKAMVVLMVGLPNWKAGGDSSLGAIVAGDLIFMLGFVAFLWRVRRRA
jgi:hypothetical protein